MLRRLYSHVTEAIQSCCGRYTDMLWRLYSNVAEAIHTVILRKLYSHVAEAIQPYLRGYTCVFVLSCFGLLVGLWQ